MWRYYIRCRAHQKNLAKCDKIVDDSERTFMQALIDDSKLKEILKLAIVEVLEERKDLVREVVSEAIEDAALSKAIDEGENQPRVSREEIIQILESAN